MADKRTNWGGKGKGEKRILKDFKKKFYAICTF